MESERFAELLRPIKSGAPVLIVKVVDLFDFHGSFVPHVRRYVGNHRVLVLANKVDLLPKGASLKRVESWVRSECKKFGVDPVGVCLVDSLSGEGVAEAAEKIEHCREGSMDVYVVGSANAGKSTFINKLIDRFRGPTERKPTVSAVPGTTLNLLSLPIGRASFLFDTPGIVTGRQIGRLMRPREQRMALPRKRVRPAVYRMGPGNSLFLGGMARLDYLEGRGLVYFTVFASRETPVHRTSTKNAEELYRRQLGGVLSPPFDRETLESWRGLAPRPVSVVENEGGDWSRASTDIVFGGLGWISVTQRGTIKVRAWYPEGCAVGERPPLMPFESRLGVLANPRANQRPPGTARRPAPGAPAVAL